MMNRISITEFLEWRVLEQMEPFGERAEWLRNGMLMAQISNMFKDKNTPAYTADDFMPQFEQPVRKSAKEMNSVLQMIQNAQEVQING